MSFLPIYTVDAFTDVPYAGNPAAVCLLGRNTLPEEDYLRISKEMNLSETAFVQETDVPNQFNLRWFTPSTEVKLCGHATLATSHTLLNELKLPFTELIFHTLSGQLTVTKKGDLLQMNFPVGNPLPVTLPPQAIAQLARAFGFEQTSIVDTAYCSTTRKLVVELKSLQEVLKCAVPAATDLMSIDFADIDVRGVIIVTTNLEGAAEKFKDCDFASRYFAPWVAIPEDPVCGSAHTVLGVYYQKKLGKSTFKAYAASPRGGILHLELTDNNRIILAGVAQTTLKGSIRIP